MTYDEAQRASRQRFEDDLRRAQSALSLTDSERRAIDYQRQAEIWREAAVSMAYAIHGGDAWKRCDEPLCRAAREILFNAERRCAKLDDDNAA